MSLPVSGVHEPSPWNRGKLVGPKAPLKLKEVWAIRIRLQLAGRLRDLALFNLAIDSKLRGRDLVRLRLCDVSHAGSIASRAVVMQRKTQRPVQFELTEQTRDAVAAWAEAAGLRADDSLFPGRPDRRSRLSTRQYARLVEHWVAMLGDTDLPAHEEPEGRPTPARPHEAREHGPIPRHRDGGRPRDRGEDGRVATDASGATAGTWSPPPPGAPQLACRGAAREGESRP